MSQVQGYAPLQQMTPLIKQSAWNSMLTNPTTASNYDSSWHWAAPTPTTSSSAAQEQQQSAANQSNNSSGNQQEMSEVMSMLEPAELEYDLSTFTNI